MDGNKNIKKLVLWTLGSIIVLFLAVGSYISVHDTDGPLFTLSGDASDLRHDINVERRFNVDDVHEMSVSTSSTNISIIPADTKEIKIHYYGYTKIGLPKLEIELEKGKLIVREKNKINISIGLNFNSQNLKLDVYVPSSYAGNLDISTSSGNASIDSLTLNRFGFSSSSGDLYAASLNTSFSELNTSSGDITIKELSGSLHFNSSSGNLTANGIDLTGDLSAKSSSGEITVGFTGLKGNISTGTSSGDVRLKLPRDTGFAVEFDTSSGDFNTDFPITADEKSGPSVRTTSGDGNIAIRSNSSSGSLQILGR